MAYKVGFTQMSSSTRAAKRKHYSKYQNKEDSVAKAPLIEDLSIEDAARFLQDAVLVIQRSSACIQHDYIYLGYRDENKVKNQLGQFVPFNFQTNIRKTGK